jgi:hypothetical protein
MTLPEQISFVLSSGIRPAADLLDSVVERAQVSRATVRRCIEDMGDQILRLGSARATRYAARRQVPHTGQSSWPLAECDAQGALRDLGTLYALRGDQWYVEPAPGVDVRHLWAGSDRGVFSGLPWFLDTARPQGFLGRVFAGKAHRLMGLPADPTLWSDDHTIAAALTLGDDLPGNLLLGDAVARRRSGAWVEPAVVADPNDAAWDSTLLSWVNSIIAGEAIGSGAGGEQPKFVIESAPRTAGAPNRHRLVKFSPALVSDGAHRMGDLLVAEHVANEVLGRAGFAVAQTRVRRLDPQDGSAPRMVLESERFDRVNHEGRIGMSSLEAPANTFGCGEVNWVHAGDILEENGVLASDQVARIRFLDRFGAGIGNTDRHLGNLSLTGSPATGWALAPVYDMLPMAYIPGRTLEVKHQKKGVDVIPVDLPDAVRPWVRSYWETLATHPLVTEEFRAIARAHADDLPVEPLVRPEFGGASGADIAITNIVGGPPVPPAVVPPINTADREWAASTARSPRR